MSKKMGRPPKPKSQIKKPALSVRLTDAELSLVQKAAKNAGLGLTEWATKTLLSSAKSGSV